MDTDLLRGEASARQSASPFERCRQGSEDDDAARARWLEELAVKGLRVQGEARHMATFTDKETGVDAIVGVPTRRAPARIQVNKRAANTSKQARFKYE